MGIFFELLKNVTNHKPVDLLEFYRKVPNENNNLKFRVAERLINPHISPLLAGGHPVSFFGKLLCSSQNPNILRIEVFLFLIQ